MHFAKFLFAKIIVKYEEKKLFFNKKNKTKHTLSQKKILISCQYIKIGN